jgi:uncharacterized alpha-E superfamily protein
MLSRVADSLYWMSRYLERAEHTSRLLRVRLDTMVEESDEAASHSWLRLLAALRARISEGDADAAAITQHLGFDRVNRSSVLSAVRGARDNARQVREQISSEVWEGLNRQYLQLIQADFDTVWSGQPGAFFRDLVEGLYLLEGLSHGTMRHGEGWRFLELGRYIERAQQVSRLLDVHFGDMPSGGPKGLSEPRYFDWIALLKQCTGFEAYCRVYTARIEPAKIAEFLIFDPEFPHSVRFSVTRMAEALAAIGEGTPHTRRAACDRLAGRLTANLTYGQVSELMAGRMDAFLDETQKMCEAIHVAVHESFISYGADAVTAS